MYILLKGMFIPTMFVVRSFIDRSFIENLSSSKDRKYRKGSNYSTDIVL